MNLGNQQVLSLLVHEFWANKYNMVASDHSVTGSFFLIIDLTQADVTLFFTDGLFS